MKIHDARLSRRHFGAVGLAAGLGARIQITTATRRPVAPPSASDDGPGPAPLRDLLALVPRRVSNPPGGEGFLWHYDDLAQQFSALNVAQTASGPDLADPNLIQATQALGLASRATAVAGDEAFVAAIGFNPLAMRQVLVAGESFGQVTLFRGDFDPAALVAAWEEAGYEEVRVAVVSAWTIGREGELRSDHPVQRHLTSAMNNAVIIDDVLVFAPLLNTLELVLAALETGGESAVDDPATTGALAALPETIVSATGMTGDALTLPSLSPEQVVDFAAHLASIREEVGSMPSVQGLVTAVEAGAGPPDDAPASVANAGKACLRLQFHGEAAARQAAIVVERRWTELESVIVGTPYQDLMTLESSRSEAGTTLLDFTQVKSPRVWRDLFLYHDLLPFVSDRGTSPVVV